MVQQGLRSVDLASRRRGRRASQGRFQNERCKCVEQSFHPWTNVELTRMTQASIRGKELRHHLRQRAHAYERMVRNTQARGSTSSRAAHHRLQKRSEVEPGQFEGRSENT